MSFIPQWIIEKKRDGLILAEDEIREFINGYTRGSIPDYQMAALAMAIYFQGMSPEEVSVLVDAMMRSGDIVDSSAITRPKADKHSTGGIGDKVSLILAPLAALNGMAVPRISGRGLGITGGTLDKLESIPGYRTDLEESAFLKVVDEVGCSIIGQTATLAPADKKLYGLRDVTGTVPSIPLITASIMCKKMAEGIDALVLDVKCGAGAFMKTPEQAAELARSMVRVGQAMGKKISALITDMEQPLGRCIGNATEVRESIDTLKGEGPEDLTRLTLELTAEMAELTGTGLGSREKTIAKMREDLSSGKALNVFRDMVAAQGGDTGVIDDPGTLPAASIEHPLPSPGDGWVSSVNANKIGRAVLMLGGGRSRAEDGVDHAVGITGLVQAGEQVAKGGPMLTLHANDRERLAKAIELLDGAVAISPHQEKPRKQILDRISSITEET